MALTTIYSLRSSSGTFNLSFPGKIQQQVKSIITRLLLNPSLCAVEVVNWDFKYFLSIANVMPEVVMRNLAQCPPFPVVKRLRIHNFFCHSQDERFFFVYWIARRPMKLIVMFRTLPKKIDDDYEDFNWRIKTLSSHTSHRHTWCMTLTSSNWYFCDWDGKEENRLRFATCGIQEEEEAKKVIKRKMLLPRQCSWAGNISSCELHHSNIRQHEIVPKILFAV